MTAGARLPGTPDAAHSWLGVGGVRIAGDMWGSDDAPLVILQHGGGQTRHAWKGLGETLGASGYRVVALDARGHGDSDWAADGAYGTDVMVEDLVCVIEALGDPHPILVGASMGGVTSLVAVGEGRVAARALVIVDVAPRPEPEGLDKIKAFMTQRPGGFQSLDEVADAIASYQPHRKRARNLDGLAKNVRLGADGKYRWHWDPRFRGPPRDLEGRKLRLEACARRLALPTLLVRGGLSDVLTKEGAREFLALCPHSEFVEITGAAHMVAGDRNDIFAGAVVEFVQRAAPADTKPGARSDPRAHPGTREA